MLNFNSIILFSDNPKKLVEFYKKVLDMEPNWEGGDFTAFKVGAGYFSIGPHSKVHGKNMMPERMMFNFDSEDIDEEFARMKKLKAKVIQEPYSPSEEDSMKIATFEDPDGNYFQLTTPITD